MIDHPFEEIKEEEFIIEELDFDEGFRGPLEEFVVCSTAVSDFSFDALFPRREMGSVFMRLDLAIPVKTRAAVRWLQREDDELIAAVAEYGKNWVKVS